EALGTLRGRAIVFMDTCHAGTVVDSLSSVSRNTARFSNLLSAPENAVSVFAASAAHQLSEEDSTWGTGAFTKVMIEGLQGGAAIAGADVVTTRSLDPFLKDGVARLTEGRQTPVSVIPEDIPDRILSTISSLLSFGAPPTPR